MKTGIHPNYNLNAKVTCACGETFTTGSVLDTIRVEICSKCHPLFTGQQKFVDTLGQVDRFIKKQAESEKKKADREKILELRNAKIEKKRSDKPSLKDLLLQARRQAAA